MFWFLMLYTITGVFFVHLWGLIQGIKNSNSIPPPQFLLLLTLNVIPKY